MSSELELQMADTYVDVENDTDMGLHAPQQRELHSRFVELTNEEIRNIKKPLDEDTMCVLGLLKEAGSSEKIIKSSRAHMLDKLRTVAACGDEAYFSTLRPRLVREGFVNVAPVSTTPEGFQPVADAADESKTIKESLAARKIKMSSTIKSLSEKFNELMLMNELRDTKLRFKELSSSAMRFKIVEMRLISLLLLVNHQLAAFPQVSVTKAKTKTETEATAADAANMQDKLQAHQVIQTCIYVLEWLPIAMSEGFRSLFDGTRKMNVSFTLLNDLQSRLDMLKVAVNYKCRNIFRYYPMLTESSNYFRFFPETRLQLNPGQYAVVNTVRNRSKSEFLMFYNSNFGSGKTTTTIGVVSACVSGDLVIYTCMSELVRDTLSQYAYHSNIKFATAIISGDGVKIDDFEPEHKKGAAAKRQLLICDYMAASRILSDPQKHLKTSQDHKNIVLVVDEPTDGADIVGHPNTRAFVKLFMVCPRRTILLSATLPKEEELQPFVDFFKNRWNLDSSFRPETVSYGKVKVGCQLIDSQGMTFVCHSLVYNCNELSEFITLLEDNQFIGRLYTGPIVYDLYNKLMERPELKKEISKDPNLNPEIYFSRASKMNCDEVKNMAVRLLKFLLSKNNDALVEAVCQSPVNVGQRYDIYGKSAVDVGSTFEFDRLGTTDAHKFLGPTIIVTSDPTKSSREFFHSLFAKEEKTGGGGGGVVNGSEVNTEEEMDVSKIISNYVRRRDAEQKKADKAYGSLERVGQMSREDKERGFIMTKDSLDREKAETLERTANSADISYPNYGQINTVAHFMSFAKHIDIEQIAANKVRHSMYLTELPLRAQVSGDIMLRLFAGIGIISEKDRAVRDRDYKSQVKTSTMTGKLAMVISDDSIFFGTNAPADNLIVDDSVLVGRSIKTALQLLARVGRQGLSWNAYARIGPMLKATLQGYISNGRIGTTPNDPEARNMNEILQETIAEIAKAAERATEVEQTATVRTRIVIKAAPRTPKPASTPVVSKLDDNSREAVTARARAKAQLLFADPATSTTPTGAPPTASTSTTGTYCPPTNVYVQSPTPTPKPYVSPYLSASREQNRPYVPPFRR